MGPSGRICLLTRQCVSRSPYSRNFGHESREQSGPAMSARDLQDVLEAVLDGVVALRDRTIHRSLAERAAERERLSAYGTIASGIAHEVKNPLGGIRGAAEILASRTSDEKSRDAAALILREVDRIRSLVDDLLVFHHRDALRLTSLNIHRVLDEVLELLSMDPLAAGVK